MKRRRSNGESVNILLLAAGMAMASQPWTIKVNTNPLDGTETCMAMTMGDGGVVGVSRSTNPPPMTLVLFVAPRGRVFDRHYEDGVFVSKVRYKIGDGDVVEAVGATSADGRVVSINGAYEALASAPAGTKLLVELDLWNEGPAFIKLDLPDPAPMHQAVESCGQGAR